MTKGDAVGVGVVGAAAGMEQSKALFSPSSTALSDSLFRLFSALLQAKQGKERLCFLRTLDSSELPFRRIQCAAREGVKRRLYSWVQPRHP